MCWWITKKRPELRCKFKPLTELQSEMVCEILTTSFFGEKVCRVFAFQHIGIEFNVWKLTVEQTTREEKDAKTTVGNDVLKSKAVFYMSGVKKVMKGNTQECWLLPQMCERTVAKKLRTAKITLQLQLALIAN